MKNFYALFSEPFPKTMNTFALQSELEVRLTYELLSVLLQGEEQQMLENSEDNSHSLAMSATANSKQNGNNSQANLHRKSRWRKRYRKKLLFLTWWHRSSPHNEFSHNQFSLSLTLSFLTCWMTLGNPYIPAFSPPKPNPKPSIQKCYQTCTKSSKSDFCCSPLSYVSTWVGWTCFA